MFYARYVELCSKYKVAPSKVALDCGFNKGSVSVWKKKYSIGEDVSPSADILLKLADYFGVTVDYLLGTEKKSPAANSDEALMFALYGNDNKDITPELLDEVRSFAKFARERKKDNK